MAPRRVNKPVTAYVLDCDAVQQLVNRAKGMQKYVTDVARREARFVVNEMTLIEAHEPGMNDNEFRRVANMCDRVPVDQVVSDLAIKLLEDAKLDRHTETIDSTVVATAVRQAVLKATAGPVVILTSDGSHIERLLGELWGRRIEVRQV